jgi:hypothetical protein
MADIMGGLLSNWGKWTGDQAKDGAIQQGLLSAGLALLGGDKRQNLGQALGQAGMQGMQQYQQQMAQQVPNKLAQLQLQNAQDEAEKRKQMASLAQQYARPPGMDNRDVGQPGESQGFDFGGYANALAQVDPMQALQLQGVLRKETPAPVSVAQGASLVDPRTGRALYTSPTTGAPTELSKLLGEMNQLPVGDPRRKQYMDAITKQTSHSPQVQVSYGSPVPIDLGGGKTGYVQPASKPGQAPQVMIDPRSGQPMLKPTDKKDKDLTEAQAKATTFLGQMRSASNELEAAGGDRSSLLTQANVLGAGTAANTLVTPEAQRINQAQEQWAESFLRFKTGAASTEQEVRRNVQTFFPRVGDSRDVIAQKKRARVQAESDMEIAAGRGTSQLNERDSRISGVLRYNPATGKVE